jgi:hypothetical protein
VNYADLLELVFNVSTEMLERGPGWAQQSSVLQEVARRVPNSGEPRVQQQILTCWHDLFREGRLSWGLNLDNPDAPFFHIPVADPQRAA